MIKRKNGRLSYFTAHWPWREDLPTLVFLHSSGLNAKMWHQQVKGLQDAANTAALDLPGHGASDGPGLDSIPAYAAVVADFIREIKAPRPIPCGLSIGSAIVLQLLLDYPASATAGILIGSGARLRVNPQIFDMLKKDYTGYINLARNLSFSPAAGEDVIREITEFKLSCTPEVAAGDFRACDRFDVMQRLGEISHRVLIISGGDDKLTPPKYADFLENNIRLASRCHLDGAGHMMPNEKPGEVNRAIRSFLNLLEQG